MTFSVLWNRLLKISSLLEEEQKTIEFSEHPPLFEMVDVNLEVGDYATKNKSLKNGYNGTFLIYRMSYDVVRNFSTGQKRSFLDRQEQDTTIDDPYFDFEWNMSIASHGGNYGRNYNLSRRALGSPFYNSYLEFKTPLVLKFGDFLEFSIFPLINVTSEGDAITSRDVIISFFGHLENK